MNCDICDHELTTPPSHPVRFAPQYSVQGVLIGERKLYRRDCRNCSVVYYLAQVRLFDAPRCDWGPPQEIAELEYALGESKPDGLPVVGSTASEWTKRHSRGVCFGQGCC